MNVNVVLEYRFDRTPDGAVWSRTAFTYSFWLRYLEVFDQVRVIARIRDVIAVAPDCIRAEGERVSFVAVPYYLGPWQYLLRAREVYLTVRDAIESDDAVVFRVSSPIAVTVEPLLRKRTYPYGLEVVGDPYVVFSPGSVKHPLRPFFRWWFTRQLKRQCRRACAVAYVTEETLQHRYPAAPAAFTTHYSSVRLPDSAFVSQPRAPYPKEGTITLLGIGSLAQLYKAPDVLIEAVGVCVRDGLDVELVWVGDGQYRPKLEALVAKSGLSDRVYFTGQLPTGDPVHAQLDRADIFVLPSKTEGLPRAMIEAMARAMPCIGSKVGGIPELLPPEDIVPPGDADALVAKIREVATDPERMARMSARNLTKAREFHEDILSKRRVAFYQFIREKTEEWSRENKL